MRILSWRFAGCLLAVLVVFLCILDVADADTSWWDKKDTELDKQIDKMLQEEIPDQEITFPDDWHKRSARRKAQVEALNAEPEWEKAVNVRLGHKVSFDFMDTSLRDALNYFQDLSGVTVVCDPDVKPVARKVTLKVTDITGKAALGWLMRTAHLDYTLLNEAIYVSTPEVIAQESMEMRIYPIADIFPPDFPGPANFGGLLRSPSLLRSYYNPFGFDLFGFDADRDTPVFGGRSKQIETLINKIEARFSR